MPDFSPSGIYGLPAITADTLAYGGDPAVLGWIQEAVQEGDLLNRDDPAWDMADKGMRYIIGQQLPPSSPAQQYIPFMVINKSRKATQAHVSALTDIKPVFGYKATNPNFAFQADLLNKLVIAAWIENDMDLSLGDTIKYALGGGTGDLKIEWNPKAAQGLGDHQLIACDFRDTLPMRPSSDPSPQKWQGVIFREAFSVNSLRQKYPHLTGAFRPSSDTLLSTIMTRFRRIVGRLQTPGGDTLAGLAGVPQARPVRTGDVVTYRCYLEDMTRNNTAKPLVMGNPVTNWSYVVEPGDLLYPQKRLIIAAPDSGLIIYDGPNPYWHGMYPFARLRLWSVPWCFLGVPLLNDTIPLQDAINDSMKDLRLGLKQWTDPDVVFDNSVASRAFRMAFDPKQPGKKVSVNPVSSVTSRDPFKKLEGPQPQVLALLLETYRQLNTEHDELTGVANLQKLMELRQLPAADTIQKYYEAMTPELRQEGRQVETFLRDLATMFKYNIFQHETRMRRRNILGPAAQALEDFDYDPGTLVPAMQQFDPGVDPMTGAETKIPNEEYVPELDASKPRTDRAKWFAQMFIFVVAPNSLLAMNAQERKMMTFQLARAGYVDFWSLHEVLETPNVGNPPPIPLPPLQPVGPEVLVQQMMATQTAMATGQPPPPQTYTMDPASGQILEVRTPMTITERLIAQQLMGIGMTENPAGRKASGQQPPKQETKSDGEGGSRSTVTESKK